MAVQVTFDVREPQTHLVRVTQRFPAAPPGERRFRMPAWAPGSYKIRDFGRHVQDLTATVGGKAAAAEQVGKDEWVVPGTAGKPVELRFAVYARELTVDTSHVTADHAHLFPATLALYDSASRGQPHRVTLRKPSGWSHWSGLEAGRLDGTLEQAEDYDHLLDCPIECGPPADYRVERFAVRGKAHRLVVWKPPLADWPGLLRDVRKVVAEAAKVFGELPYEHYTFLAHVAAGHGGGLEHRNSTVLGVDPLHLASPEKVQANFLPLVAHEFVHTWNVKRILPAAFQPYELQRETYTDLLWLFEGFTSYYELPLLARAGVVTEEAWGKLAGEMVEWYEKALGRRRTSVAKASRLTWTLLYQPHEHNINRNVSYYTKGMWVGLCLDAELRRRGVREGLDAVMRLAWRKHGRTGVGLTEDAFPYLVEQAVAAAHEGGRDSARRTARALAGLRAKLKAWTQGTAELPLAAAFRRLGWDLKLEHKDPKRRNGLGLEFKKGTSQVERIREDMPAWKVLQPDDEVAAAFGYKWSAEAFAEWAAQRRPGEPAELAIFREGRLRHVRVPLVELPKDKATLKPRKGAAAARARKAWLGAAGFKPKPKE